MKSLFFILIVILTISIINCDKVHKNKYSEEANNKKPIEKIKNNDVNYKKPANKYDKNSKNSEKIKEHKKAKEDTDDEDVGRVNFEKYEPDFRNIQYPFRMSKLNLVWTKAQHRLTEPKLKSLFMELKIHDKEELAWKQLNSQHKDKDGLKEAELRLKLTGIMSTYGLLEHFDEAQDPEKHKHYKGHSGPVKDSYRNKSLFKDKKLNHLWEKAEAAGFTPEELKTLKEEFEHHQDKVDLYYNMLDRVNEDDGKREYHENAVNAEELDRFNEILTAEETNSESNDILDSKHDHYTHKANQLREKHRDIRDSIDRLERITAKGPNNQDFIEPKVQGLWRVAVASDFSADELASLKTELLHYESRLLKLRQMHVDHALSSEKHKNAKHGDKKQDKMSYLEENIKKQQRKVERYHAELEKRIFKHTEL